MPLSASQDAVIRLSPEALRIHGKSEIVLCASLFYFRLPRGTWKDRLHKIKRFGYNAIDVYFPWNHHESEEGVWDFTGEKDVGQFLQEAAEAGLWVIARPGPYICSEWDGGALPAYLLAQAHVQLRQNDPAYLQHVARWYAQIMPIIRKYEEGQGGSVIAVQLENELDFYPCADPHGYISALRDMALQHGISVPLIACAGQGGLLEASGFVEQVVPTCNFYPNDRDPVFVEKVRTYQARLAERGYPLLVTETNRSHFLLRRLLSAGAKLLGPYLQASGTNFGFTNAANNWGNPLSFLTSDYDFHGMISPEGHIRQEAYEGRLQQRVIQTYGCSLAEAVPTASGAGPDRLALKHGGELLFLANVDENDAQADIASEADAPIPAYSKLVAVSGHCPILPLQVPLHTWGIPGGGMLDYATAELLQVQQLDGRTLLVFHTAGEGEIRLSFEQDVRLEPGAMQEHEGTGGQVTLTFQAAEQEARAWLHIAVDHVIEIVGMSRDRALLLESIDADGQLHIESYAQQAAEPHEPEISWALSDVDPLLSMAGKGGKRIGDAVDFLEKNGIYRGFAWYTAQWAGLTANRCQGFLLHQASDVISLYAGDTYVGTIAPGGASCYLPLEDADADEYNLTARVEIWGHTNFHDTNLPALHLNSLKGLTGLTGVTHEINLMQNWRFKQLQAGDEKAAYVLSELDDEAWPLVSAGGWLSADQPAHHCYRKQVRLSGEADSWVLHAPGNFTYAYVYVNGYPLGQVNPLNPYVDLTPYVKRGETAQLTFFLDKTYGQISGHITLYEGIAARAWSLAGCQEEGLLQHALASQASAKPTEAHKSLKLKPGAVAWLYGELQDDNDGLGWRVYAVGANMKLTVFLNGHLVGRLWLPGGANRPIFRGGSDNSFYLPGAWFHNQPEASRLVILLEAVSKDEEASLEPLRFIPVSAS
ncbi:beta-galactosidase [Paenibacillus aestuarii]|uniref:Beta-galactosidase n=1 Tax=Paenibacillus aestuarii TaxID=516965 RepID=A0ABW0K546_9BACL|nr:beta-galactosidase [Paenibacillus aestuarii]